MTERPIIDHDSNEMPRRLIKLLAICTIVITAALIIPINLGIRWIVDHLASEAIFLFDGVVLGLGLGYVIGGWDARRQSRTAGKDA